MLDPAGKAFVEAAGFGFADAEDGFDSCGAQGIHPVAGNVGIGVGCGGDDALNTGGDEGMGARAGAAGVITGLEGDVGGSAFESVACMLLGHPERNDFGVVEKVIFVPAFADHLAGAVKDNAADGRVGRGDGDAASGQFESAGHPVEVEFGLGSGVHGVRLLGEV